MANRETKYKALMLMRLREALIALQMKGADALRDVPMERRRG